MASVAQKTSADLAELLSHLRAGHREGHYYVALFGLRNYDPVSVVDHIRRGLSYAAFERFHRNTALSYRILAQVAEIPERTLARRKKSGRFGPDETDRLVRTSRIVARAIELFEGSTESAQRWLTSPVGALGGRTPIEFASTGVGAIEVESLIGRLAHGIPT
ncbi:MAG: antitoxin Xre/MbcA/ParS toxin-binding domain-containing protein [Rhodococcus sp. (in: high G+C Gram-positive bacteria)]